jgi:hypothetical protein
VRLVAVGIARKNGGLRHAILGHFGIVEKRRIAGLTPDLYTMTPDLHTINRQDVEENRNIAGLTRCPL